MSTPRVSLCLLTYNEEDHIGRLLTNCAEHVDEIVVLDGGSTDRTLNILRSSPFSDKIIVAIEPQTESRFSMSWDEPSDFYSKWNEPSRRNKTLSRATADWIIRLDPDECLDDEMVRILRSTLAKRSSDVYFFPIYTFWRDLWTLRVDLYPYSWYPSFQPRLFRNNLGIRYSEHLRHCYPSFNGKPLYRSSLKIGWLDSHIFHYHYALGTRAHDTVRLLETKRRPVTRQFRGTHPEAVALKTSKSCLASGEDRWLSFRRTVAKSYFAARRAVPL